MKKINFFFFPIILLFGIFTAKAQSNNPNDTTYHPLVQEGKMWSILDATWHYNPDSPIPYYTYDTKHFMFQGDTIISDVAYKKIYSSNQENPIYPQDYYLSTFMREDENKKVFQIKRNGFGEQWEELLYDFSLEVGDTVPEELYYCGSNCSLIVEVSDEIMLNGEVRKVFHFSRNGFIMEDYWIEGIGSNYGPFIPFGSEITGGFYRLLCFHENNELMFYNEEYQTCHKKTGINAYDNQIIIYPNPTKDRLYIEMKANLNIHAITLINIQGQIVRGYESSATQLDVSGIAEGIYFLKLSSSEGDIVKKILINK